MESNEYTKKLENVIKQKLQPLKNIPFNLVIETMTGKKVISFDFTKPDHKTVLGLLKQVAINAEKGINKTGILRPRPNEIGNKIETYIRDALNLLKADNTVGPSGNKKAMGYPDILFWFNKFPYYLECKTYNIENREQHKGVFIFRLLMNLR